MVLNTSAQSKSSKRAKRIVVLLVVAVTALAGTAFVFQYLGFFWHLFWGNSIEFESWRIPVPKAYYVRNDTKSRHLFRHEFGIPFVASAYGHISIFGRTTSPTINIESGILAAAQRGGLTFVEKLDVTTKAGHASCFEFRRTGRDEVYSRCVITEVPIVVFYEGAPRFRSDLQAVLQGIAKSDGI